MTSKKRNKIYYTIIALYFLAAASLFGLYRLGFRLNIDGSAPKGVYLLRPKTDIRRGDLIAVDTAWDAQGNSLGVHPNARRMLKLVEGVGGDTVEYANNRLVVNGREIRGTKIYTQDAKGRAVRHPDYPYVIPRGYYLAVSAAHEEKAWDSRYFGPVPDSAVTHKVRCLWR